MPVIRPTLPDPTDVVAQGSYLQPAPPVTVGSDPILSGLSRVAQPASALDVSITMQGLPETFWPDPPIPLTLPLLAMPPRTNAMICTPTGAQIGTLTSGSALLGQPFMSTTRWQIVGTTRDASGNALPSCRVLVLAQGYLAVGAQAPAVLAETISSAVDGSFTIDVPGNGDYGLIAYKPGEPATVAGITLFNTVATNPSVVPVPPSGARLWFYDDTLVSVDGLSVDQWSNAGAAGGAVVGSGASRPTVAANNVIPSALFVASSSDVMTGGPAVSGVISAAAYTMAAVIRTPASLGIIIGTGNAAPAAITESGGNWYPLYYTSFGFCAGHIDSGGDKSTTAFAATGDTLYVVLVTFDGGTISLTMGGATQTVAAGNVVALTGNILLGSNYNGAQFADLQEGEILVYNTFLSASDQASLTAYLRGRFPSAI